MTPLGQAIQDYLALRRRLGFKLRDAGLCLVKFAAFMEARDAPHITTALALEWIRQSPSVTPATWAQRLGYVRGFARHHAASDPQTEVPPAGLLPFRPRRARPYLYSDEDIAQLLRSALDLPPAGGLRPWTYHTLLGLLSVAGLRVGEAIRSSSIGPLLRAMSFVPARITTARGRSATTSHWNRANICAVTCPLIPRAAKPFASKNEG